MESGIGSHRRHLLTLTPNTNSKSECPIEFTEDLSGLIEVHKISCTRKEIVVIPLTTLRPQRIHMYFYQYTSGEGII